MAVGRLGLSFRFRGRGLNLLNHLIDNWLDGDKPNEGDGVFTHIQLLHARGI